MTLKEYNEQLAALMAEGAQLAKDGMLDEAEQMKARVTELTNAFEAEKAAKAEDNMLNRSTAVPAQLRSETHTGEENTMPEMLDASSKEYRNAFLKYISGREDQMTKLENAAFTHTTENTPAPLPTTMLNEIWDLVKKNHVIVGDITLYKTGTILTLVKHTAIVQGKAKSVKENTANDDEQNTFVTVTLSGKDFSKSVELSYAEAAMSIDALESYLTNEIATQLGEALADDVVTTVEAGINTANKVTAIKTLAFTDITKAFGLLKRVKDVTVYCTRATLYNRLATLTNTAGQLIYQPSATAGVPGTLLGAQVKLEDSVADDVLLIGDPKRVVGNMIQDVMVETDKDIKLHKYIYSGYARGECVLVDGQSFAQLTVTTGA